MRRLAATVAVVALLAACSDDGREPEAGAPALTTTSTSTSTTTSTSSTTTTTTTAPPTTTTTTPPAAGTCPPARPLAAPDPNRPQYTLRLALRLDTNTVEGDMTVRFVPDLPTDRLVFRLWPNGPRPGAAGARLTTGPVQVDGRPAAGNLTDPTTLVVPTGLAAGRAVTVSMPWQLTLPRPVDDRISRTGDDVRLGSFFPILAWEPGVGWQGLPPVSGFAEASVAPTADFTVTAELPPGLSALATGTPDGAGRWRAERVRDFAISIGRFRTVTATANAPGPVQVTVGASHQLVDDPSAYLSKVVRSLEDFGRRFGPYPWSTFTLALQPTLAGGIEYPQHVMQGPGTIGRTTSHEVGHQWFYGLVGNDQGRDPWLDEGLATWAETRFEGSVPLLRARTVPPAVQGRAGEPMTFWEPRRDLYYRGVYVQGAQAIAAAGAPDLVDCALRRYVEANAYRVARPADLLRALEEVLPGATGRAASYGVRPSP